MYLHMTVLKMDPEQVHPALQAWSSQTAAIPGAHQVFLVESLEEPGRLTCLSLWDSLSEARAFLTSPSYAALMAELKPYLLCPPQWYGYNVLKAIPGSEESVDFEEGESPTR